jgi:hypothetical protein
MKPHRRKPAAPRRKDGAPTSHGEGAPGHGDPVAYPAPEEVAYDPAMAFAEIDPSEAPPAPAVGAAYAEEPAPDPASYSTADPAAATYAPGVYDEAPAGIYDEAPANATADPHAHPYGTPAAPAPEPAAAPLPPPAPFAPAVTPAAPALVGAGAAPRRPAAGRRPATPRTRTGYRPPRRSYGGGFSPMSVFMVIAALGLVALIAMILRPADLSGIQGYPQDTIDATAAAPRNLLGDAQQAMIDRSVEMIVTEEELNQYLNRRLEASQGGVASSFVTFRGIYVDLSPGKAEIFIEREIFGFPITKGVSVRTESARRQTLYRPASWTIGQLDLGTRNVKPVMDLFTRIRGACSEEWLVLQQMPEVRFEENRVVIDPRL